VVLVTEGIVPSPNGSRAPRMGKPTDRHAANRFYVEVGATKGTSDFQAVFSEVSGLQVEMQTTDFEEGGENNFVHKLPGRMKVSNVTLKRGLVRSNEFLRWLMNAALVKPMDRRNVSIVLFDQAGHTVMRWNFLRAFPVKWVGPQFTADSTTIAIESVELAHEGLAPVETS
jgi:phage tail-like protein